jgi:hypothetical protein
MTFSVFKVDCQCVRCASALSDQRSSFSELRRQTAAAISAQRKNGLVCDLLESCQARLEIRLKKSQKCPFHRCEIVEN